MIEISEEAKREFLLAEYREAANAYFKGVDIGYTTVKSYITINGLFAALIGALAEPKSGVLAAANEIVKIIPFFALAASFAILAVLDHYFAHLENCQKRCAAIEKIFGGLMFTKLGGISETGNFDSGKGLKVIIWTIITFWVYFAIKSYFPDVSIWNFMQSIFR